MQTINTYYDDYISLEKFVRDNSELLSADNNRAVMVQVFSGICDENYLLVISKQIRELIPHAQVIGTTTNGEIMNGLVSGLKTVLSFSVFHHSEIKVVFAEKKDRDDYELGHSIATSVNSDRARILILFSTGLTVNASQLLEGIQSLNPDLPVAGGNAGDNYTNTHGFVCCNEDITDCGVVGVIIEGDYLTVSCHHYLGWQPIGKEMTITRAEGSRVYTIDHIPAYQVYCHYLEIDSTSDIIDAAEFPLTICKTNLNIARAPFLRYDDDSISFFGDIAEGEKVQFSFGHVEMILEQIDTLLKKIKQQPVESIFVYSCASRRAFLQESTQIETLPLQKIAPSTGFFTSGEFFHVDNCNYFLNTTMTTLALSEAGDTKGALAPETGTLDYPGEKSGDETTKDNIADRSIVVLRALTSLVNKVTSELNNKTIDLQMVNQQIQEAREAAEAANQAKSQFLANVSHEIRTPLTGIIGMTELLLDTALNENQKDLADSVLDSSLHLLNIINEILDFSKMEAGKLTIKETTFEINSLLKRVVRLESAQLGGKKLELISLIDPTIPQFLIGDPIRLTQVLLNLTGNAIKFTDQGRISIQVFADKSSDAGLLIRFEINDTGIGIAREDQDNLFSPFMQVDNSTTRTYGGTGLGLVISRELVNLMGGEMGFDSEVGKGSTFWFTIPFKEDSLTSGQTEKAPLLLADRNSINNHELPPSTNIDRPTYRVLLVEDDPVCRKVANLQLDKLGIVVDQARNGVEAVKATLSNDYSLILMDCHMPGMDGFTATRAIRAAELENGRHLPIIAMTARALEEDKDLCAAAGMDDYLSKPFDSKQLFYAIKQWLPKFDL
ncbi:MAG TPA: FIST N-terminal domain-containing protein [Syntrophomonadaceae bacterium]|nr:FIST N-terminal domain-containing protein [Syntrophomonadaceae bacterium]